MNRSRISVVVLIVIGLVSALTVILGNIASGVLPYSWKPYLWIAWPLFFIFSLVSIVLAIWQRHLDQVEVGEARPSPIRQNRFQKLLLIIATLFLVLICALLTFSVSGGLLVSLFKAVPLLSDVIASVVPRPTSIPASPPGWKNLGLIGEPISDFSSSDGVIYVATNGAGHGVFKSEDFGESWRAVNNGLLDFDISQVEVAPKNPDVVYAVGESFWRSIDGGGVWSQLGGGGCIHPLSIALVSNTGSRVVLTRCGTLAISGNGGESLWDFSDFPGNRLISAPFDRTVIYGFSFGPPYSGSNIMRVVIGENWQPLAHVGSGLEVYDLTVGYNDPSLLFVGTPNGVYRSEDGGGSWVPINETLPGQGQELDCRSIQTSPWKDTEVFAICNGELFHSEDKGIQWTHLEGPLKMTLVHPLGGTNIILAATSDGGIWSYEASWVQPNTALPPQDEARGHATATSEPGTIDPSALSQSLWEGTIEQTKLGYLANLPPEYRKWPMTLFIENVEKLNFSGKMHWSNWELTIEVQGEFVMGFGDEAEQSRWLFIEGFGDKGDLAWIKFEPYGFNDPPDDLVINGRYYARVAKDGTMKGVYFSPENEIDPVGKFTLVSKP